MKKILLFAIIAILLLFNNCSKDSGANYNNSSDTSLKVKTLIEDYIVDPGYGSDFNSHTVFTFEYDAQNRLIKMLSDSTNIDFEYSNNLIRKNSYRIYNYGDKSTTHEIYYFNNITSLLDSFVSLEAGEIDTVTVHSIYLYNSENRREKEFTTTMRTSNGTIVRDTGFYKYDNNGNLSSITKLFESSYFTYSDSLNFHNSADMIFPGRINNPNLLKEVNSTFNTVFYGMDKYSYKFDSNHRISVVTDSISANRIPPATFIRSFTYY